MANLKNIINNLKLKDEVDEAVKESLEILSEFSNLKLNNLEKEIERNLISGAFENSYFKVPILNIITKHSGEIARILESEDIFIDNILIILKEIFKDNNAITEVIIKKITKELIKIFKEDSNETIFSLIVPEKSYIIRYDFAFYSKTLYSKKIREKIQNNFSYIIIKSLINTKALVFNDFFSLYSTLLNEYFDGDIEKIQNNLVEMKEIYSIILSE